MALDRLISPFEATANYTKMKFVGFTYTLDIPFTIKETPDLAKTKKELLEKQAEKVVSMIKN